jgi:hypothetical protein
MLICFLLRFFNASFRNSDAISSLAVAPQLEQVAIRIDVGLSRLVYVISIVFSEHALHGIRMILFSSNVCVNRPFYTKHSEAARRIKRSG